MVPSQTSPLFDSFIEKIHDHDDICRVIATTAASISDTVARTRRTITESRELLERTASIPDRR
jgi:hypothetical protein